MTTRKPARATRTGLRPRGDRRGVSVGGRQPIRDLGRRARPVRFPGFIQYTAEVNAFMPAVTIPFLAWAATVAATSLGVALIAGLQVRWAALASAALLALFGTAMAISLGPKSPLDYSVFSASAGALLLALHEWRTPGTGASSAGCDGPGAPCRGSSASAASPPPSSACTDERNLSGSTDVLHQSCREPDRRRSRRACPRMARLNP